MAQYWDYQTVNGLYEKPLTELLFQAYSTFKNHFNPDEVQLSTLCNIKTGACPENCAYCPQSAHYNTGLERQKLMDVDDVVERARLAKDNGATRFCMGAAWRSPPKRDMPKVLEMVRQVKALGLETCVTLGMLDAEQTRQLKEAGLDYYNHNLDTSPEYYDKIITTRTYQERLETLQLVRDEGIKVCCGGIIGMGEGRQDRIELLRQLANMEKPPESVPINRLIAIEGTPLENTPPIDPLEFVRTIAAARIMMPQSVVRLAAGRDEMDQQMQALCFMAGANSIFLGETLLTAPNPEEDQDWQMLSNIGKRSQETAAV